jgi:tetratricopeptide (TPR) repeat protein
LINLGSLEYKTGRYQAAAAALARALEICNDLGMRVGQADTHKNLGLVEEAVGDHHGAISHLDQALEMYYKLDDRAGQVEALTALGESRTKLKQLYVIGAFLPPQTGSLNVTASAHIVLFCADRTSTSAARLVVQNGGSRSG